MFTPAAILVSLIWPTVNNQSLKFIKNQEKFQNQENIHITNKCVQVQNNNDIEREIYYGSEKYSMISYVHNDPDLRTSGYTNTEESLGVSTKSTCTSGITYTGSGNKISNNNSEKSFRHENNEKKKKIIDHDLPIITGNGDFKGSSNKMRHFDTNIFYSSEYCEMDSDEEERKVQGDICIFICIYMYMDMYYYMSIKKYGLIQIYLHVFIYMFIFIYFCVYAYVYKHTYIYGINDDDNEEERKVQGDICTYTIYINAHEIYIFVCTYIYRIYTYIHITILYIYIYVNIDTFINIDTFVSHGYFQGDHRGFLKRDPQG
jgi:hypothetical protein